MSTSTISNHQNIIHLHHNGKNGESKNKISEVFGSRVFSFHVMKEYLTESTYSSILNAIERNAKIDMQTAENVAKGLKKWAMDLGATHYTHWFQPLTGSTAEKHDAFFKPSVDMHGRGIEYLSASELVAREPDASSFPHGGLRDTSEARGYTIWDPSSPAFIIETVNGLTLYIPAVYISYTGESLDHKTPLLKSGDLLNKAATDVCRFFDDRVTGVIATLGWEQEYFLIDEKLYQKRPDIQITGRTLFGSKPAKGQQLEDHYFATIPERVQAYMQDFEREALKVGIPVLTRHNEVAPGQYECAPMFEELNIAVDHNLLLMDIMSKVAQRHGLRVLFHEKPFSGVNGSGKHNNWSMATNNGKNLLSPGNNPGNNLQFITFFVNVLKAMNDNGDLLRASIASQANEHRLGANEAPPAIVSVFTGSKMAEILAQFKTQGLIDASSAPLETIDLNIHKIPVIPKDNTDRNRTSPFPFTGNKFEFRAVGSSANCSAPMMVLNTIVAHQLIQFKLEVDVLITSGESKQNAIVKVIQQYIKDSERIIFNGDGYSKEWEKEATKRGLKNIKSTPDALLTFLTPKAIEIFSTHQILTKREIHARHEILLEEYIKKMDIEVLVLEEMIHTHILPFAFDYLQKLTNLHRGLENMSLQTASEQIQEEAIFISSHIHQIRIDVKQMMKARETALAKKDHNVMANMISQNVKPYFDTLRYHTDQLEKLVDASIWKLPKYQELLFNR